jgi:hypothetical protein
MFKLIIAIRIISIPTVFFGVLLMCFLYGELLFEPSTLSVTEINLEENHIEAESKNYSRGSSCPPTFITIIQTGDLLKTILPGYIQLIRDGQVIKTEVSFSNLFDDILPFIMFSSLFCFLPRTNLQKQKIVVAWIEIHKEDLLANWQLAVNGKTPFKIKGLDQ